MLFEIRDLGGKGLKWFYKIDWVCSVNAFTAWRQNFELKNIHLLKVRSEFGGKYNLKVIFNINECTYLDKSVTAFTVWILYFTPDRIIWIIWFSIFICVSVVNVNFAWKYLFCHEPCSQICFSYKLKQICYIVNANFVLFCV